MEQEILRYMFSTLAPVLVIGGGWILLRYIKKSQRKDTTILDKKL